MREHVLNDFKYSLEPSSVSGYQCVEVTFLFDEKVTKRFIYIKNDPSVNYIQKAKQIIKHELETGELIKYAKKYHRRYYKKPILIGLTVFFLIVAGVSTGLLAYHYLNKGSVTPKPKPTPTTDTVELVVSNPQPGYGLDLKNKSSTEGKEYDTDFVFTHPAHDVTYCLPSNLDQVKVGDNTITTGYTYDLEAINLARI